MYPATPSITSQQNPPIHHCRQQEAIPCTRAPTESMETTAMIIKRNISFPTKEKPLSIVPLCTIFLNHCSFLLAPKNFSYKEHAIQSAVSHSHIIQNFFSDPQYCNNGHFWEKGSRNNVIFYTTYMYQKLPLT